MYLSTGATPLFLSSYLGRATSFTSTRVFPKRSTFCVRTTIAGRGTTFALSPQSRKTRKMSTHSSRDLPGHGLPISDVSIEHPVNDLFDRITAQEVAMLRMMNGITDKPGWYQKVLDDSIVAKWSSEAEAADFSEDMIDWCIGELREKAEWYRNDHIVTVLDVFAPVAKADEVVSTQLREELRSSLQAYRGSVEHDDWHPGSNEQVLNLVHPSLYPLVYGRTHALSLGDALNIDTCLSRFGAGNILPVQQPPAPHPVQHAWQQQAESFAKFSYNFQWLPCEVQVGDGPVKITSYINNLHPVKSRHIYHLLEQLIERSIPLWNKCLPRDVGRICKRIECDAAEYDLSEPINYAADLDSEEVKRQVKELAEPEGLLHWCQGVEQIEDEVPEGEVLATWLEENADDWSVTDHMWRAKRELQFPEPEPYATARKPWLRYTRKYDSSDETEYEETPGSATDLSRDWLEKGLQVIVKIASIELTPDKAQYAGGSWHLEGMQNEHIAATALYYYDCQNVTESRLRFRQRAEMSDEDMHYEQGDHEGLEKIYGLPPGGLSGDEQIQELGSVMTNEGRLLAFPNVLQHKVEPFELEDKTQSGWRRFIALWLVDPHNRIISTENVPPQQHDWWQEALIAKTDLTNRLPVELIDQVYREGQQFTMTLQQAKEYRLKLMAERTAYVQGVDEEWREATYNFCEH